jgi:hypothetical protein
MFSVPRVCPEGVEPLPGTECAPRCPAGSLSRRMGGMGEYCEEYLSGTTYCPANLGKTYTPRGCFCTMGRDWDPLGLACKCPGGSVEVPPSASNPVPDPPCQCSYGGMVPTLPDADALAKDPLAGITCGCPEAGMLWRPLPKGAKPESVKYAAASGVPYFQDPNGVFHFSRARDASSTTDSAWENPYFPGEYNSLLTATLGFTKGFVMWPVHGKWFVRIVDKCEWVVDAKGMKVLKWRRAEIENGGAGDAITKLQSTDEYKALVAASKGTKKAPGTPPPAVIPCDESSAFYVVESYTTAENPKSVKSSDWTGEHKLFGKNSVFPLNVKKAYMLAISAKPKAKLGPQLYDDYKSKSYKEADFNLDFSGMNGDRDKTFESVEALYTAALSNVIRGEPSADWKLFSPAGIVGSLFNGYCGCPPGEVMLANGKCACGATFTERQEPASLCAGSPITRCGCGPFRTVECKATSIGYQPASCMCKTPGNPSAKNGGNCDLPVGRPGGFATEAKHAEFCYSKVPYTVTTNNRDTLVPAGPERGICACAGFPRQAAGLVKEDKGGAENRRKLRAPVQDPVTGAWFYGYFWTNADAKQRATKPDGSFMSLAEQEELYRGETAMDVFGESMRSIDGGGSEGDVYGGAVFVVL